MSDPVTERDGRAPEPTVVRPQRDDPAEMVRAWLTWFGWGRIVAVAVSIMVVVGGAWLLLRAPTPPVEQALPMTSNVSSASTTPGPDDPGGSTSTTDPYVVVHVAGAVRTPGVYSLRRAVRLHDAIDAAGGALDEADLDRINLAEAVVDGQRIYVPEHGVEPPAVVTSSDASPVTSGPVDINRADADTLQTLPGVGPAIAAAIVDDRVRNGPFASVDELDRVSGIGPAKLAAIRELVTV